MLPDLSKYTISSFVVLAYVLLFDLKTARQFSFTRYDLPALVFCIVPILTSLSNDLGLWDGLSSSINTTLGWGVPYLVARLYFKDVDALKDVLIAVAVAALLYLPLVWIEIIISPRLHGLFYGFDQGSWIQNVRYGGWRPQVFMQHGLMVAFFMAISTMVYFAIDGEKIRRRIFNIPVGWISKVMLVTVIFCKSGNGVVILLLGLFFRFLTKRNLGRIFLLVLILSIPTYIGLRTVGGWDGKNLLDFIAEVSDSQRAGSVRARMIQESLFAERVEERWLLGWGGWSRAFPVDEFGNRLTRGVDSLWIIVYGENGFIGLVSVFSILLIGPYLAVTRLHKLRKLDRNEIRIVYTLCAIPVLFSIDSLMNAMYSPLYPIVSGALISLYLGTRREARLASKEYPTMASYSRADQN